MGAGAATNPVALHASSFPRTRARCSTLQSNGKVLKTPHAILPTYRGQLPHLPRALLPFIPGGVLALSIPASEFALLNTKTGLCGGALTELHPGASLQALAALPPSITFLTLRAPNAPEPTAHIREATVRVDARAARLPLTTGEIVALHQRMRTDFAESLSGTCSVPVKFAISRAKEAAALARSDTLFGAAYANGTAKAVRDAASTLASVGFTGVSVAGLYNGESPRERCDAVEAASIGAGTATVAVLGGDGEPGDVLRMVGAGADLLEARFPFEKASVGEAIDFESGTILIARDKRFSRENAPLVVGCQCHVCRCYSSAYIHHLLDVHEMIAPTLLAVHNLYAYLKWIAEVREAVAMGSDKFRDFSNAFLERRAQFRAGGIPRGFMPL